MVNGEELFDVLLGTYDGRGSLHRRWKIFIKQSKEYAKQKRHWHLPQVTS